MMRATIFVVALKISVAIGSTSSDMSQQLSRREALETDMIDTTMIAGKGRMTSAETQQIGRAHV